MLRVVGGLIKDDRPRLSPLGPWHAVICGVLHCDEAVATWYGGRRTASMAQAWAARAARAWERDGVHEWMAYSRADGSLIGRGGLSGSRVDGRQRLEVGWTVRSGLRGRGYAAGIGAAARGACPERPHARAALVIRRHRLVVRARSQPR
jgi:RimJ/RimL family protein N-acetyltransferase